MGKKAARHGCTARVVGCECDYEREVPWDRIGEQSFGEIWNSHSALNMRHCIRSGQNLPAFCGLCPYKDRVQDNQVLSHVILHPLGNKTAPMRAPRDPFPLLKCFLWETVSHTQVILCEKEEDKIPDREKR